jgi:hypothetical protein
MVLPMSVRHARHSRRQLPERDSLTVRFARCTEEGDPMRRSVRLFRLPLVTLLLVVPGFMLIPALATASAKPDETCKNITGTVQASATPIIVADDIVGFDVVATTVTGDLEGSMTAEVSLERITPGGTIHFTGVHYFAGSQFGNFQTSDRGLMTPNGRVNNDLRIVDGASGFIKSHGTVDPSTLTFHVWYHGRVCT